MSTAPSSLVRVPTPPHVPEHIPDPDPVPFGLPDIAPLIPEPVSASLAFAPADPYIPQPPPVEVAPPPPFVSDTHRTDLPIVFLQEILAPRPGEGTSGQPPSSDMFASADFPPIPHFTPFPPDSLDEPVKWFQPYSMPVSDPYDPSHHVVLELEFDEGAIRSPFPFHPTFVPPPSPSASFVPPPAASTTIPGFDAPFFTFEQQISYLIHRVHELEEELAHDRSLLFFPPPPPLSISQVFGFT
ncbi:hypothetical protein Hanom_Chr06g00563351 [Helianthus anomalus]